MRIAFLTSRFFPESTGGAETYTYNIARHLKKMGHEVSVLYAPVWEQPQRQRPYQVQVDDGLYDGMPVRKLRFDWQSAPDRHGFIFLHNPIIESRIIDWLHQQASDIVHITSCIHLTGAAITAATKLNIPTVLTFTQYWTICPKTTLERRDGGFCHGRQNGLSCLECLYGTTRPLRTLRSLPKRYQNGLVSIVTRHPKTSEWNSSLNLVSAVERRNKVIPELLQQAYLISPSRFLARTLVNSGLVSDGRICYSPHGHDVVNAEKGSEKTHSPHIRFGFTGNVLPHKGVHLLVEAFSRLDHHGQAKLFIYGDLRSAYGEQVHRLGVNNPAIEFRGRFDNKDIGRILQEIDILVVPSVSYENAPVTIAEAFAANTPVIATNLGGMAEAIQDGTNGLLFELNNVAHLESQMRRLVESPSLIDDLRSNIPSIRTVDNEARALVGIYGMLTSYGRAYNDR